MTRSDLHAPAANEPAGPMLAIYGHAVTWRHLIITALVLLMLMSTLALAAGWWAWQNLAARVVLQEQQADILLPRELAVQAQVTRKIQVKIDQTVPVRVPIHQDVTIPLDEAIPIKASINTVVPIQLDVPIKHVLKLDQTIELDTQVKTKVLGIPITLPIQGRFPIKADVPVDMVIPVRKQLPLSLETPAKVRMTEPLHAQIDTVVETEVPIHQALALPVTAPISAKLTFPQQHVQAGLHLLDLTVPFRAVTLLPRDGASLP